MRSSGVLLALCFVVPLPFSAGPWVLLLGLPVLVASIFFLHAIYIEEPLQFERARKLVLPCLCLKAVFVSLLATPCQPDFSWRAAVAVVVSLIVGFRIIGDSAQRLGQVAASFSSDAVPRMLKNIETDLASGILESEWAEEKRAQVVRESTFYEKMELAAYLVAWELAGSLLVFLSCGMSPDYFLWIHLLTSCLISISLGMIVSRMSSDSNLD